MKRIANRWVRHTRDIFRFGILYEYHILSKKMDEKYDAMVKEKYYTKHPQKLMDDITERYYLSMGTMPNITSPQLFTEYIQWARFNGMLQEKGEFSDKVMAKKLVESRLGNAQCIIKTLGVWDSFDEIEWNKLPKKFILKCSHGSGYNLIVEDKDTLDIVSAKKMFDYWMDVKYEYLDFEMQYKYVNHRILAEEYIEEADNSLHDYKFHCFNGKPKFVQVIDRDRVNHSGTQAHMDMEWNNLGWTFEDYPMIMGKMDKPINFEKMVEVAEKLSYGFPYVRVDLYNLNGQVYFGEMTFTPRGGYYPYTKTWTYEKDRELGELIMNN